VSIGGFRMLGGGKKITKVLLAGKAVTSIVSSSDILVVVRAASQNAGKGDVVITADIGSEITLKDSFTYDTASTITKVNPATGQLGTVITLTGTVLLGKGAGGSDVITSAKLGSTAADVVSSKEKEVVIKAKNANAGAVDVVLEATNGAITTKTKGFTYNAIGVVKSATPAKGQLGTKVVIAGERLLGPARSPRLILLLARPAHLSPSQVKCCVEAEPKSRV
jgi:hypothetical protein